MNNLVYKIIDTRKPFIYFHTLLFNENILRLAANAGKSLEIDVSMNKDGDIYIGHPYEFYEYKNMIPPPHNLPFLTLLDKIKNANLYLILDCKDVRALPVLREVVKDFGADNVLFHSWVIELEFKPYAPDVAIEPHWVYEDLPMEEVLKLKEATGVPVVSSARGLTTRRLEDEPEIVNKIIEVAAGKVEAINFNLPSGLAPSKAIMNKLLDNGLLTWLNVDQVPKENLPPVYMGISDHLRSVSNPSDFE